MAAQNDGIVLLHRRNATSRWGLATGNRPSAAGGEVLPAAGARLLLQQYRRVVVACS